MNLLDLRALGLRTVNATLQDLDAGSNETAWTVTNPMGQHAIACGLDKPMSVDIQGHVGFYCGGKGIDIVVGGSVGHMSGFMAQLGHMVICGDAGDALGDSIYEAKLYVAGSVESLGADCIDIDKADAY